MNVVFLNNNKVHPDSQISLFNPSFLYGINVFEGIRGYWRLKSSKLFLFDIDEHLDRLFNSINLIGFSSPINKFDLKEQLLKIVKKEEIQEDVYIRITFFIDSNSSWAEQNNISYIISIRSLNSELGFKQPCSLGLSTVNRISNSSMPPSVKAGANYLNSRYALLDCKRNGYDGALFISANNFVSESTGSCIFFIKDNTLYTPSKDCDILVGITRNRIIALAQQLGINVLELQIKPEEIYTFESAFLAGTMIEIMPILNIDSHFFNPNHKLYIQIIKLLNEYIYEMDV